MNRSVGGPSLWLTAFTIMIGGCQGRAGEAPVSSTPARFTDVASSAGLRHRHHLPILDPKVENIMPWLTSIGAAVAAGDYDRDGRVDLYITDSLQGEPNHLYRNNGDGTFVDAGREARLADVNGEAGVSMDAVWGDYDNDGWIDLYLVRWGRDSLFHNNGDGTFTEVSDRLFRRRDGAPGIDWANGNAAVFLDYNLDGRLDIYVGNYFPPVDLWHLRDTRFMHDSFEHSRNGGRNFLFRQDADGTFTEVAGELAVDDPGWTLAVGSADLNNDGWPDLYVANDFGPDQLFLNSGDGRFENATAMAIGPDTKKGMNVDFGDFNNDGWLDIYVSNITTAEYLQEGNMLWRNNGPGPDGVVTFTDVALEAGAYDGGWGWGAKFFDPDNDGDLDIVAVNGFISAGEGNYWYDLASWTVKNSDPADARNWPTIGTRSFSGYERTRYWRNDGLASFTERGREEGLGDTTDGRGIAVIDYDNDGDLDLCVANQGRPPHLYRNEGRSGNHWLTVVLESDPSTGISREAIGARVTLLTPDGLKIRERDGGKCFSGQSDARLHFGLGRGAQPVFLQVRWPDGGIQYEEITEVDRFLTLRQDRSRYVDRDAIPVPVPQRPKSRPGPARQAPVIEPAELERQLVDMEARLAGEPLDPVLASAYRARCALYERHDRAIGFLESRVAAHPGDAAARIELSAAYVDKIPTCGGVAAIVCKGSLARKGLDQLDIVVAQDPDSWLAHYVRGMNHLHWPAALLHSDDAARDFERCIAIQERPSFSRQAVHDRAFVGLGDALVKSGDVGAARRAWRRGLDAFPGSGELRERLVIEKDEEVRARVRARRSLEQKVDTDLSMFGRQR